MVDRKEIEHLEDLVKVEIDEPERFINQVDEILKYFERLDRVELQSFDTVQKEVQYEDLREDTYEEFLVGGKPLIEYLKKDQNNFVRAPKMI